MDTITLPPVFKGSTSVIVHFTIGDSTATTGAGNSALAFNTASLTAYYMRPGDTGPTSITLATCTLGTYSSGGFKLTSAANQHGTYEFHVPNACLASGANSCIIVFQGATATRDTAIIIPLIAINEQLTPGSAGGQLICGSNAATTFASLTSTGTFTISDGLVIARSTGNSSALIITGTGTGSGAAITGGLTGKGIALAGGGTSGTGLSITTTDGDAVNIAATGSSRHGVSITGGNGGTSDGLKLTAGTGGRGLRVGSLTVTGNTLFSDGVTIAAPTTLNRPGLSIIGNGLGEGIFSQGGSGACGATFQGVSNNGVQFLGDGNGGGILCQGGATGFGIIVIAGGNNDGIYIQGAGNGAGMNIIAGASGTGIIVESAAGDGIDISATGGDGVNISGTNTALTLGNTSIAGTLNITGAFTSTSASNDIRGISILNGGIVAASFGANSLTASALATDAVTEINAAVLAKLPAALVSGRMDSSVGAYQTGMAPLQPTTAGRTLDVSAGGEAGMDWNNIGTPSATVNLSNTRLALVDVVTTVTNNPNAGNGAYSVQATVTDGTNPLQQATIRVTSGINTFSSVTDASGHATFALDAGTYTITATKSGYEMTPTTRTVTGNNAGTLYTSPVVLTATVISVTPTDPTMCIVHGFTRSTKTGALLKGVQITATLKPGTYAYAGGILVGREVKATSDANGLFQLSVTRNDQITVPTTTEWHVTCKEAGINITRTFNASTFDLRTVLT